MDSLKTNLPAVVIEQLYRHSLVVIDDAAEAPPSPAAAINGPVLPASLDGAGDRPGAGARDGAKDEPQAGTRDRAKDQPRAGARDGVKDQPRAGASDKAAPQAAPLRFLGNNSRRIAILVSYPGDPFLPEASLQFLTNILHACQLNIGDTAIVNAGRQPVDFPLLRATLDMEQLILFGNIPGIIPPAAPFSLETINGVHTLMAPALDEMNGKSPENERLKGKLWKCLKQMFRLSGA